MRDDDFDKAALIETEEKIFNVLKGKFWCLEKSGLMKVVSYRE